MEGRRDGWIDGWTDRRMDGQMDGRTCSPPIARLRNQEPYDLDKEEVERRVDLESPWEETASTASVPAAMGPVSLKSLNLLNFDHLVSTVGYKFFGEQTAHFSSESQHLSCPTESRPLLNVWGRAGLSCSRGTPDFADSHNVTKRHRFRLKHRDSRAPGSSRTG